MENLNSSIRDAIEAGKAMVNQTPIIDEFGATHVMVPNGFALKEIHPLNPVLPAVVDQQEVVIEQESFCEYINRFKTGSTVVFAFPKSPGPQMIARLDYHHTSHGHDRSKPDTNQHQITFKADFDENWKRWREIDRKNLSQVDFAYFIEENLHTIAAPDGADLLDMAQNLKIHRGVVMKSVKRLKDGTMNVEYSEKDDTSTEDRGSFQLPDEITIVAPIYLMRGAQQVVAKLRYRLEKGEPLQFRIDILNRSMIEFEAFHKMAGEVRAAINCPVYLS